MEKYSLAKEVGKGSFGTVFKATNKQNLETCAIKKVRCDAPENVELALQEFWTLSHLQKHLNIIKFEECFLQRGRNIRLMKHGDVTSSSYLNLVEMSIKGECHASIRQGGYHLWFVMEYCDEGDMNEYILSRIPIPMLNTSFMLQLADGISFLHKNNVVHRDLKPENILVQSNSKLKTKKESFPVLKIADFGLSKVCFANESSAIVNVNNCWLSSACGSDFFMAPEVFEERYTAKADVFALGIIFWAIMDRITFIDASTKKVLLGTYVRQDKKVLSVGEALLDDPKLDVLELLKETSLRQPVGSMRSNSVRIERSRRRRSCSCVAGDVIKLRKLVALMVDANAELRPSSDQLLSRLKNVLQPPTRNLDRKTRIALKQTEAFSARPSGMVAEEKPGLKSSPKFVRPPSRPVAIVRSKRKEAARRHVHRMVDAGFEDPSFSATPASSQTDTSPNNRTSAIKEKEQISLGATDAGRAGFNTNRRTAKKSTQTKKLAKKKPKKVLKSRQSTKKRFVCLPSFRLLRSEVTDRQKSLRSYEQIHFTLQAARRRRTAPSSIKVCNLSSTPDVAHDDVSTGDAATDADSPQDPSSPDPEQKSGSDVAISSCDRETMSHDAKPPLLVVPEPLAVAAFVPQPSHRRMSLKQQIIDVGKESRRSIEPSTSVLHIRQPAKLRLKEKLPHSSPLRNISPTSSHLSQETSSLIPYSGSRSSAVAPPSVLLHPPVHLPTVSSTSRMQPPSVLSHSPIQLSSDLKYPSMSSSSDSSHNFPTTSTPPTSFRPFKFLSDIRKRRMQDLAEQESKRMRLDEVPTICLSPKKRVQPSMIPESVPSRSFASMSPPIHPLPDPPVPSLHPRSHFSPQVRRLSAPSDLQPPLATHDPFTRGFSGGSVYPCSRTPPILSSSFFPALCTPPRHNPLVPTLSVQNSPRELPTPDAYPFQRPFTLPPSNLTARP